MERFADGAERQAQCCDVKRQLADKGTKFALDRAR